MTLDEYFSTGPERERPIFEAVVAHLRSLGDVHVEPVSVGIFIKRDRGFVELRPKVRWVAMSFPLSRPARPPTHRPIHGGLGPRTYHVVNLHDATEVDDEVRDLLTQAWFDLD